jgi:NADH dehydrogenase
MDDVTRIVIVGGGFAGTTTALQLERLVGRRPDVKITLIDSENFFTFTPLLPEVPSGSIQPKHIVFPLRALLKRTHVRQAHVHRIDLQRKVVTAAHCNACGADHVPFDHLVLALGSVANYFNLPGVEESSLTIKSLADATGLHAHLIDKLEHADLQSDPAVRKNLLTFDVAGGGFAGVETLAEINDFVHGARRYYPNIQDDEIQMILVHSGKRILPEVNESLSRYAISKLRKRGVEVQLETRVLGCQNGIIRLSSGRDIRAATFVWAAGTAPSPIIEQLGVPRSATGRIDVDASMAVRDRPGIWAIGDSASIPDLNTGGFCPPTAQFALRQGKRLAKNIAAAIDGQSTKPFRFKSLGLLAGLGRHSAVAEIFGMRFSGFVAWWLWRTIYLMKLPGFERKVRVALDWSLDLFFPRDIVYLRPLHNAQGPGAVSLPTGIDSDELACEIPRHDCTAVPA